MFTARKTSLNDFVLNDFIPYFSGIKNFILYDFISNDFIPYFSDINLLYEAVTIGDEVEFIVWIFPRIDLVQDLIE